MRLSHALILSGLLVSGLLAAPLLAEGAPKKGGEAKGCSSAEEAFTAGKASAKRFGGAFFFQAGMAIDADGAPEAYHPDDAPGLDALANAGKPGKWWGVVTDGSGAPVIQKATDPAPGFYVSATSLEDTSKDRADPTRYVDSSSIAYVALPPAAVKDGGAALGDFAVVRERKSGKIAYAIFADIGPKTKLGEGSIALAEALGVPSSARRGGASGGVDYVVFPGSGDGAKKTAAEIAKEGEARFTSWGGLSQLDQCLP
jgi:hypothetical protein